MDNNVDFAVAVDVLNRKIAELNIKISLNGTEELDKELNELLDIKTKIYDGDELLVKKIINGEIG